MVDSGYPCSGPCEASATEDGFRVLAHHCTTLRYDLFPDAGPALGPCCWRVPGTVVSCSRVPAVLPLQVQRSVIHRIGYAHSIGLAFVLEPLTSGRVHRNLARLSPKSNLPALSEHWICPALPAQVLIISNRHHPIQTSELRQSCSVRISFG